MLIAEQELTSNSNGTGSRDYYFDVPFVGLCQHVYIEFAGRNLTTGSDLAVELTWDCAGVRGGESLLRATDWNGDRYRSITLTELEAL